MIKHSYYQDLPIKEMHDAIKPACLTILLIAKIWCQFLHSQIHSKGRTAFNEK